MTKNTKRQLGYSVADAERGLCHSFSIVTPSLNQSRYIGEALASVRLQGNSHKCEHLVIDGRSTDGTIEILSQLDLEDQNSGINWVSESDSGQSNALNKGFRKAKGEIIGWLNSDDRYRPGCFERISQAFTQFPEADIIYGDYAMVDKNGCTLRIRREIEFSQFILNHHKVLYIASTATFFRRRIFDESNWLDEDLHYAMDLEFFLRLSARGYKFKHLPCVLADYRLHSKSKTCNSPQMQQREHLQIILTTSPILTTFESKSVRELVLPFLQKIAAIRRYIEKMFRGYYGTGAITEKKLSRDRYRLCIF